MCKKIVFMVGGYTSQNSKQIINEINKDDAIFRKNYMKKLGFKKVYIKKRMQQRIVSGK